MQHNINSNPNPNLNPNSWKGHVSMRYLLFSLAACLLVLTYNAQAQSDVDLSHLKSDKPDELYVEFYEDTQCGWNLEPVVESELENAGIDRKRSWDFDELVLYVNVYCIENKDSAGELLGYVYDMNIAFGHFVRLESHAEGVFVRMHMEPGDYSTFGVVTNDEAGNQQMRESLREIKGRALADYWKANGK